MKMRQTAFDFPVDIVGYFGSYPQGGVGLFRFGMENGVLGAVADLCCLDV
jgi:hypothetical protein